MKHDTHFDWAAACPGLQLGDDGIFYAAGSDAISYPEEGNEGRGRFLMWGWKRVCGEGLDRRGLGFGYGGAWSKSGAECQKVWVESLN